MASNNLANRPATVTRRAALVSTGGAIAAVAAMPAIAEHEPLVDLWNFYLDTMREIEPEALALDRAITETRRTLPERLRFSGLAREPVAFDGKSFAADFDINSERVPRQLAATSIREAFDEAKAITKASEEAYQAARSASGIAELEARLEALDNREYAALNAVRDAEPRTVAGVAIILAAYLYSENSTDGSMDDDADCQHVSKCYRAAIRLAGLPDILADVRQHDLPPV